ncbi:hypothetical protein D3C86_1442640 [compost metagenome]
MDLLTLPDERERDITHLWSHGSIPARTSRLIHLQSHTKSVTLLLYAIVHTLENAICNIKLRSSMLKSNLNAFFAGNEVLQHLSRS